MQSSQTSFVAYNVIESAYNVIDFQIKQSFRLWDHFWRAFNGFGISPRKAAQMAFATAETRLQIGHQTPFMGGFFRLAAPALHSRETGRCRSMRNSKVIRFTLAMHRPGWQKAAVTTGRRK